MHAHGIDVFDGTDNDAIVSLVAHHFHLIFFPAQNRLFDQHFGGWRCVKSGFHDVKKFVTVIGNATACPAQREGRPNDTRKPDGQHAFVSFDHGAFAIFFLAVRFTLGPFFFKSFGISSVGFELGVKQLVGIFCSRGIGQMGARGLESNPRHGIAKQFPVLSHINGFGFRTNQLDVIFFKYAHFVE